MTSKEIKDLRKKMRLTQQEFADVLKVDFKTVNRWENNKAKPSNLAIRILKRLEKRNAQ